MKGVHCAIRTASRGLLLTALLGLLAGCGYQASGDFDPDVNQRYQWKSLYRTDFQTVAVPIFTTRSFDRGVETRLSSAVIKQIEQRTPYKVVARDRAETVLEGEIEDVEVNTISQSPIVVIPQEQQLTIRCSFTWKEIKTGRILVERKGFSQSVAFYPTLGEGRFVGTQDAVEKLAVAMVQQLEAEW